MDFFAYESIKHFVVYAAFGWILGISIMGYAWIIISCVRWIVKHLKDCFGKETVSEEEEANE